MAHKRLRIDLLDHPNPAEFLEEARKRYPDKNVSLSLDGTILQLDIDEDVHPQIQVEIFSYFRERVREDIVFRRALH